jgi:cytochrome c-type biogenesis protein CcmH/NrfF
VSPSGRSWLPWLAMASVLVVALAVGATRTREPDTLQDRVTAIAKTVKCPTCRGESVADSNAPISKEIRRDIAARLEQGQSPGEIRAAYVTQWGDEILLTPSGRGVSGLVWAIPVVAVVLAGAGLVVVFRRWRSSSPPQVSDADRELVEQARAARAASEEQP